MLIFSLFLILIYCKKAPLEGPKLSIENLAKYWDHDFDRQRLFKLRLAFAKTVAKAFKSEEFSKYFKNKFGMAKDSHFEELFFALYKDDVIGSSGSTLYEHLQNNIDAEAFDLFGSKLLDLVLQYDPCVVIKLPDVFRQIDWNVREMRPAVIPQMPYMPSPEEMLGENNRFIVYYFTGEVEVSNQRFDYFHVIVKYSEDYALIEPNSFVNDKGISLYELIPQVADCDYGMRRDILELGKPHAYHKGLLVVRKMDVFNRWQSKCGFKGKYWSHAPCPIAPNCPRECVPMEESVIVVDSFRMTMGRIFELNDIHMDESYTYSWTAWSRMEPDFIYRLTVPSLPHEYFETRAFQIQRINSGLNCIPKLHFRYSETFRGRPFPVFGILKRKVSSKDVVKYSFDMIVYADRTILVGIAHPFHDKIAEVHASEVYPENLAFIEGCTRGHYSASGQGGFWLNW